MYIIGKIDRRIYQAVTPDITTDTVIITEQQIAHIKERHPKDFNKFRNALAEAVSNPDYILKDDKHQHTALILKRIEVDDKRLQLVLRLQTPLDLPGLKNSIISLWEISEGRWNNYIRNKTIIYKRE